MEVYSWVSHINYNSYSYPDPATVTGMHWATGQALPTSLCEARRQLLGAPGIAGEPGSVDNERLSMTLMGTGIQLPSGNLT